MNRDNAHKEYGRDYILFSVYLLLATMAKPSFTIVLVGGRGILMLWRMFHSKFRNFMPTIWLGVCFLPTFADLLYQFRGVFVPQEGQEGGIGFTAGTCGCSIAVIFRWLSVWLSVSRSWCFC